MAESESACSEYRRTVKRGRQGSESLPQPEDRYLKKQVTEANGIIRDG